MTYTGPLPSEVAHTSRIYLDHASAPIPDERIFEVMHSYEKYFANPGASHEEGRLAKEKLEEARMLIGRALGVKKDEIIFTSGGTEANNLGIVGLIRGLQSKGHALQEMHAVTSRTEHPSVLECFRLLEQEGLSVTYMEVNTFGLLEVEPVLDILKANTVLVSFAYVNSEIGVVQPIRALALAMRKKKADLGGLPLYIHTDASQAPMYFDVTPHTLAVDLMTIDALKMRGPKGSGALFARLMTPLHQVVVGGGQERGLRPGTESVVGAHGLRASLEFAIKDRKERVEKVTVIQDYAIDRIIETIEGAVLNGHRSHRSPNNVSVSIKGIDSEYAAVILDTLGISCSTRSACLGDDGGGSDVVRALSNDPDRAVSTLRFTLGEETSKADIDHLVEALKKASDLAKKS